MQVELYLLIVNYGRAYHTTASGRLAPNQPGIQGAEPQAQPGACRAPPRQVYSRCIKNSGKTNVGFYSVQPVCKAGACSKDCTIDGFHIIGQERVAEVVDRSCLSTINLCEVLGRFARDDHDPVEALNRIRETSIEILPFDSDQAALAAALAPALRPRGLSLGEACLALAVSRDLPALTADRAWIDLDVGVEVRVIR